MKTETYGQSIHSHSNNTKPKNTPMKMLKRIYPLNDMAILKRLSSIQTRRTMYLQHDEVGDNELRQM